MNYTDIIKQRQHYANLAKQRQCAALKLVDAHIAYAKFRSNEERLYRWLRTQKPKAKKFEFELAWKKAGNLCCGVAKTLQSV